jgi:hypothetical protein
LDFKYGYQAAILENQLSPITPELMAAFSTGLSDQAQCLPYNARPPGVPGLKGNPGKKMFFIFIAKNRIFVLINQPTLHLSSIPAFKSKVSTWSLDYFIYWVSSNILFRSVGFAMLCIALVEILPLLAELDPFLKFSQNTFSL